jgi:hypothetical protein
MNDQPEIALKAIREIESNFKEFCDKHLYITEADTRINLIDRILEEVLFWPASEIQRESHSYAGYLDYTLHVNGKPFVCLEAKKEGVTFEFPKDKARKNYQLNGTLVTDANIREAVDQVRSYCDENAIRYAIATNGYTWIIFRAIREDIKWREGNARVFHSIQYIIENFTEFWNLLSYPCIVQGSLDFEFSLNSLSERESFRVLSYLLNPDNPLIRNPLNKELNPIISHFFQDIADPNYIETLQNCYVYSTTIKIATRDIDYVIRDTAPKFLQDENVEEVVHFQNDAGVFGRVVAKALQNANGQLFLLLGGIGSGKTTFQRRYQLTVGAEVLQEFAIWFSIDFLKPPTVDQLEIFVWKSILDQMRNRYSSPYLESRKNIKRAFRDNIEALRQTALYGLNEGSTQYESILSQYLGSWQKDLTEYVPRLLAVAKPRQDLNVVLFFDNVDQLSPNYQAEIFLLAQRVTDKVKSITIIALREESYYTASVQKVFTAYINRKFHIASPPFRKMIGHRIKYALTIMSATELTSSKFRKISELQQKQNIVDFLKIVEYSVFTKNRNIARFIDHLCFGNMRQALEMFSTFLVSGVTDVEKMLRIYRREGTYYVAFHEFVRSIMLGDRYYYKEAYSSILNVFECGKEKNSSHFTSLRLLNILNTFKTQSSREGEGFHEIVLILSMFEDVFDNKQDCIKSLGRLVYRRLIETNTKNFDSIEGATHIRITSAGWYYLKYLSDSFAYLDLVFQDTPFNDSGVVAALTKSINRVNNLADPEDDKISRMDERFRRVGIFLSYLLKEEDNERGIHRLDNGQSHPIYARFMPQIIKHYEEQKQWINRRLNENKEKYEEEFLSWYDETLDGIDEDEDVYPDTEAPEPIQ